MNDHIIVRKYRLYCCTSEKIILRARLYPNLINQDMCSVQRPQKYRIVSPSQHVETRQVSVIILCITVNISI